MTILDQNKNTPAAQDSSQSSAGRWVRVAGIFIILIAACGLGALWFIQSRTESVWVVTKDVTRYAQLTEEVLEQVDVPKRRAKEIAVLPASASPMGQWASVGIPRGTLLTPDMLQDTPPERRVLGDVMLPVGWRGYGVNIPTALASELRGGDLVDLVVYETPEEGGEVQRNAEENATLLLQKLPLLKLTQAGEGGGGGVLAILALQPNQAIVLDGQLAKSNTRPLLLLSQEENPDLPSLQGFDTQPVPEEFGPVAPLPDDSVIGETGEGSSSTVEPDGAGGEESEEGSGNVEKGNESPDGGGNE